MDIWDETRAKAYWNSCFSRHLNDWELGVAETSLSRLQDKLVRGKDFDQMIWKGLKHGVFFSEIPLFSN